MSTMPFTKPEQRRDDLAINDAMQPFLDRLMTDPVFRTRIQDTIAQLKVDHGDERKHMSKQISLPSSRFEQLPVEIRAMIYAYLGFSTKTHQVLTAPLNGNLARRTDKLWNIDLKACRHQILTSADSFMLCTYDNVASISTIAGVTVRGLLQACRTTRVEIQSLVWKDQVLSILLPGAHRLGSTRGITSALGKGIPFFTIPSDPGVINVSTVTISFDGKTTDSSRGFGLFNEVEEVLGQLEGKVLRLRKLIIALPKIKEIDKLYHGGETGFVLVQLVITAGHSFCTALNRHNSLDEVFLIGEDFENVCQEVNGEGIKVWEHGCKWMGKEEESESEEESGSEEEEESESEEKEDDEDDDECGSTMVDGYQASANVLAAHNFTMPALSPTMTEGNIASWKVKEGDEFVAGDALLEVETDKAQMDVEAQDDGIMAKIMTEGGSKGVKVGTRIAVIADAGDDISSLEIPPEVKSTPEPEPAKEESKETSSSSSSSSTPPKSAESSKPADQPKKSASKRKGAGTKQKYPLYPSVQVLIHQNHLNADDIPSSGPNGRLLKGDVLAFMDKIAADYPKEVQARFTTLSHLDLSNIKLAAPKEKKEEVKKVEEVKEEEVPVQVAVGVSLAAVMEVQRRMSDSLGITLPLSTFLARAVALANEDLPASRVAPTANELFDAVLGLDKIHIRKTKNGAFAPDIVALPDPSARLSSKPVSKKAKKADLFDQLVAAPRKTVPGRRIQGAKGVIGAENIFSLSVGKQEEKRAKVFLERVKTVLEAEPGRLVL